MRGARIDDIRWYVAALALVAAAIAIKLLIPDLSRYVVLFPAVLLAAFLGGRGPGHLALATTTAFVIYEIVPGGRALPTGADVLSLAIFVAAGLAAIHFIDTYRMLAARLRRERLRLEAALRAAHAATWEISPAGTLRWDENFFRLVGLDPASTPPSSDVFLAMIHPEDRPRLAEARRLMERGDEPRAVDEYRLTRPDGSTVWLENHRTSYFDGGRFFIGVTQDISRRKIAEERVAWLLREAGHRAKNQLAVVMAVAREISTAAGAPAEFEEALGRRLQGLARSHDLLVTGDWKGAGIRELIVSQIEPFGAVDRCTLSGEPLVVSARAAQYLGMAFHELGTNAVKHGALSKAGGSIEIVWRLSGGDVELTWRERGGLPSLPPKQGGFGTKVLEVLVPGALSGRALREFAPEGLVWTLMVPADAVIEGERRESGA
jgi:PAS domain S-box-containing protein